MDVLLMLSPLPTVILDMQTIDYYSQKQQHINYHVPEAQSHLTVMTLAFYLLFSSQPLQSVILPPACNPSTSANCSANGQHFHLIALIECNNKQACQVINGLNSWK